MSLADRLAHHRASAVRSYLPYRIQAMKLDARLVADFVVDVEEITWQRRISVFCHRPAGLKHQP